MLFHMKNTALETLEKRIQKIKSDLNKIGEMRPGSLTEQFKNPENKTGGYYQLSYTHDMKSRTDYIRKAHIANTERQIRNHKKFKELTEEWVTLSIEHAKLVMRMENN